MIRELTEAYTPKKILHRDKQLNIIRNTFQNFKDFGVSSNLLLQGVTGSGKTTIISRIKDECFKENFNDLIFVSGADTMTSFKTFKAMFDLNCSTIEKGLSDGINILKKKPKIIIIDEVNKIKDTPLLFNSLNTLYRATQCPLILITNKRTLIDNMPDDARLTLFFDKVEFPSYNAMEIKDIIEDRLKNMERILVPEYTLAKICAYAGRQGSARMGLQILMKCVLANDYTLEYIDKVSSNIEREDWKTFVNSLTFSERRFLDSLISISDHKQYIRHSDLTISLKDLSPSRISQLVTIFEDYGVLVTEYRNNGRGQGRYRVMRFVSQEIKSKLGEVIYSG